MKLKFISRAPARYLGDGLACFAEYPKTCIIEVDDANPEPAKNRVSSEKARQLLADYPHLFVKIVDKFLVEVEKVVKNPKYRGITIDMMNDYVARNYPDLVIKPPMRKAAIAKKILGAAK